MGARQGFYRNVQSNRTTSRTNRVRMQKRSTRLNETLLLNFASSPAMTTNLYIEYAEFIKHNCKSCSFEIEQCRYAGS
ncbi:hypothetical protein Mapa_017198 [Marchantia paleacea]|nr:hypothetical protein Mapa_017198 [Marchantia paleacea]